MEFKWWLHSKFNVSQLMVMKVNRFCERMWWRWKEGGNWLKENVCPSACHKATAWGFRSQQSKNIFTFFCLCCYFVGIFGQGKVEGSGTFLVFYSPTLALQRHINPQRLAESWPRCSAITELEMYFPMLINTCYTEENCAQLESLIKINEV